MKTLLLAVVTATLGAFGLFFYDSGSAATDTKFAVNDAPAPEVRFRLDPAQSTFIAHANRAGIAWFKGHSHRLAIKDFDGEASLSLDAINPASLTLTARSASIEETDPFFNADQKKIINKEVNELVLETAKYPEITFHSTAVKGSMRNGAFDVKITGDLTLHGVTKQITIPATVTVNGDTLRAKGEFSINRKKWGVNATKAFHGFVKVRHTIKFEFDIIGRRV
jgi:polyisoprenoid-binding protein YceI